MSLNPTGVNINLGQTQRPQTSNPRITSGSASGSVFNGRSNDFLSPNNILGKVDGFSNSVRPVTSNTLTAALTFTNNPIPNNSDFNAVLSRTDSNIGRILNGNFGDLLAFNMPVIPTVGGLVPDLGVNPDPGKINLFTSAMAQAVQPMSQTVDPANFNPLGWVNPNSGNILLGSLQAQSGVLNGSGLNFPMFSPFPTQAVTGFPFNPFGPTIGQTPSSTFFGLPGQSTSSPIFGLPGQTTSPPTFSVPAVVAVGSPGSTSKLFPSIPQVQIPTPGTGVPTQGSFPVAGLPVQNPFPATGVQPQSPFPASGYGSSNPYMTIHSQTTIYPPAASAPMQNYQSQLGLAQFLMNQTNAMSNATLGQLFNYGSLASGGAYGAQPYSAGYSGYPAVPAY